MSAVQAGPSAELNTAACGTGLEYTSPDLILELTSDGGSMFTTVPPPVQGCRSHHARPHCALRSPSQEKPGGKLKVKISSRFLPPDMVIDHTSVRVSLPAAQPRGAAHAQAGDTFTDMSNSEQVSQMSIGEVMPCLMHHPPPCTALAMSL